MTIKGNVCELQIEKKTLYKNSYNKNPPHKTLYNKDQHTATNDIKGSWLSSC